jgi:hypothetical protein
MNALASLFVLLLAWHCLADYPLQGDFLSKAKAGAYPEIPWQVALVTHAFIQAAGVLLITGNWWAAGIELVLHTAIDYGKAQRNAYSFTTDQALHVATKLLIVGLRAGGKL